jgi:phage terminase small subunit
LAKKKSVKRKSTRARGRPRKTSNAPQHRYTPQMRAFVDQYFLCDFNAYAAAKAAGYSAKSARSQASKLLNNPLIRHEIEKRHRSRGNKADITADRVLSELGRLGFSDLRDVASWTANGLQLKSSEEISDDAAASLRSIKESKDGVQVTQHDKKGALELLGKHLGLFREQLEVTGEIQLSRAAEDFDDKLQRIAKRLGAGA